MRKITILFMCLVNYGLINAQNQNACFTPNPLNAVTTNVELLPLSGQKS